MPFKRGGSPPNHAPRYHANTVSMRSEQEEEDDVVRSIVKATSASPHFAGAAVSSSTKGKEPVEQVATDSDLEVTFTNSGSEEEPAQQFTDAHIFGSDSSDSSEEEPPEKHKLCNRYDSSDQPSYDNDSSDEDDECVFADSSDEDDDDDSDVDHTHKQNEQEQHKHHDEHQKEIGQEQHKHHDEQQPTEEAIEQEEQEHYDAIMKTLLDLCIVDFCSELCKHDKPPHVVYMVLDNMSTSNLLLLQQEMQKRFERADDRLSDLGTDDTRQLMAYVNYINEQAHLAGHTASWIKFLPWSRHAWAGAISLMPRPLSRCLQKNKYKTSSSSSSSSSSSGS